MVGNGLDRSASQILIAMQMLQNGIVTGYWRILLSKFCLSINGTVKTAPCGIYRLYN
jgi:hypothetical protein